MANLNEAFNNEDLQKVPKEIQNNKQNEYQMYNYFENVDKPVLEIPIGYYYQPAGKNVAYENKLRYSEYQNKNKYDVMEKTTSGRGQILLDDTNALPANVPFLLSTTINENPNAVEKYDKYGINSRDFGRKKNSYYKQTKDKHASKENYFV